MMQEATKQAFIAHALAHYPREACGLVVRREGGEAFVPCDNVAEGLGNFVMRAEDYATAEDQGEIVALVHSHPDAPATPSIGDKVACEQMGLPWFILEVRSDDGPPKPGDIRMLTPEGYKAPLLERPFFHGVLDCYTLVQDWYERERNIVLPKFDVADGWWHGEEEIYLDNYKKAGFVDLKEGEPLQIGDIILMQLRSKRVNHAGIYIGDGRISERPDLHLMQTAMLHHVYGRPSERVVYGGMWAFITRKIVRHRELI